MMKEAIGIKSIRIGDVTYTDEDLESLPLDQLEMLKMTVNSTILEVSSQIRTTQAEYSDSEGAVNAGLDWYVSAKHVLVLHQKFLPYLSYIIKRRRAAERPLEAHFMDVAREELEAKDFEYIVAEAKKRRDANARK